MKGKQRQRFLLLLRGIRFRLPRSRTQPSRLDATVNCTPGIIGLCPFGHHFAMRCWRPVSIFYGATDTIQRPRQLTLSGPCLQFPSPFFLLRDNDHDGNERTHHSVSSH
jgi:hypothetical protein